VNFCVSKKRCPRPAKDQVVTDLERRHVGSQLRSKMNSVQLQHLPKRVRGRKRCTCRSNISWRKGSRVLSAEGPQRKQKTVIPRTQENRGTDVCPPEEKRDGVLKQNARRKKRGIGRRLELALIEGDKGCIRDGERELNSPRFSQGRSRENGLGKGRGSSRPKNGPIRQDMGGVPAEITYGEEIR